MSKKPNKLEKACKDYYDEIKSKPEESRKSRLCADDGKVAKNYITYIGWFIMLIALIFPIIIYVKENTEAEAIAYFVTSGVLLIFGAFLAYANRRVSNGYCRNN
jgi:uncharacterized membrane protein